ncbi:hypothetical protein BDZ89DRAFT_1152446 [Hymenopellis radicata]|nr:hypothetical protein BDZ89DRAFT_1152446 [Hymenopellis radicata]
MPYQSMDPIPDFCNFKLHQLPEFAHPERSAGHYRTAMIILDLHIAVQLYRDFNSFMVTTPCGLRDSMELGPGHDYDSPLLRFAICSLNPNPGFSLTETEQLWGRTFFVALDALVKRFLTKNRVTISGFSISNYLPTPFLDYAELHSVRFHDTLVNLSLHTTKISDLNVYWMYRILVPSLSMCDNLLIEPDALSVPNRELVEWWEDIRVVVIRLRLLSSFADTLHLPNLSRSVALIHFVL